MWCVEFWPHTTAPNAVTSDLRGLRSWVIPRTVSGAWICSGPNRSCCGVTGFWSSWISLPAGSSVLGCRPWPSMGQRSAACSTMPSPGRGCPRGSVPIMIRCSGSTAGRPICGSWTWKRCKRCPRFPGPIHLSNGSSGPSAGSIWTICSFGRQMTWNESWSCSKSSTTRRGYTKGYPATRPGRKRAAQPLNPPALRITAGKATATDCLNCPSLLKWQFAMYRSQLGLTSGWKRSAVDFYEPHGHPKQVWVRELVKKACVKLRAAQLPPPWAEGLPKVPPRCTAKAGEITSLMERLGRDLPEFRRKQSLAYPIAGMLALIAMAVFSGVTKGYEDLADYAATLSQGQLRALRFRFHGRTGRVRCPQRTSFQRVLTGVNAEILERVLLLWQEQVLGPVQDKLVVLDGKELRHADVESVNAVSGTGRWLGSTKVKEGSNEIPAAREQLAKLDVVDKIVLADAAHTQ